MPGAPLPQGGVKLAWGHGGGVICQSGAPNGLGRGGNWWWSVLYGPEMVETAYLDFILGVHGLGKTGSQWIIFTLREAVFLLPWQLSWGYIAACAGLCCLCDGVLKGHLFSSLPLAARGGGSATWSMVVVAAKLGPEKIQCLASLM